MFLNTPETQSERKGFSPWRVTLSAAGIGLFAVLACVWLGAGGLAGGGVRLSGAWESRQFRLFAYVAVGSLAILSLLAGWLYSAARRARLARGRALGRQEGTAILEFAMVLPIALAIVLLMIQSSLLMGGFLCVNYASYCAARAAVVFVPDTFSGEPTNEVADYFDPELSEKISRIRQAAVWAVLPVSDGAYPESSDYSAVLAEGISEMYSSSGLETPGWVEGYLGRKLAYAEHNTSVELSPPVNGERYEAHEDLRVVTKHNLYLAVPYAARVLAALDSEESVDFGDGRYALRVSIPCTLRNEGIPDTINLHPGIDEIDPRW
ncbi:MAG: pilus assembly protein [Phycisphaerae bacterium]|nr:pilus assembly protein [Phycisphaerae bacterium]